jgi:hypothetical protein
MVLDKISNLFGNSFFHLVYEKIDDVLSLMLSWEYFNEAAIASLSCLLLFAMVRSAFALRQRHFSFLKSKLAKTRIDELPLYFQFKNSSHENISLYDEFIKGKKSVKKYTSNMYFSLPLRFSKEDVRYNIIRHMNELGLEQAHDDIDFLEYNIRKLFSVIAYYNYDDLELKQMLINQGWDFSAVNYVFQTIDSELREIINESFLVYPNDNVYTVIKKIKIIATQGYTVKNIYSALVDSGYSKSMVNRIDRIIKQTQKVNNKLFDEHNSRIYTNLVKNTWNLPDFNLIKAYQNF